MQRLTVEFGLRAIRARFRKDQEQTWPELRHHVEDVGGVQQSSAPFLMGWSCPTPRGKPFLRLSGLMTRH